MRFTSVHFKNFKAFRDFTVSLDRVNILVGPNNSGKSTILSAFRALQAALQRARTRKPEHLGDLGWGYRISREALPLSLENIHTDCGEVETLAEFRMTGGEALVLRFPIDGGCLLLPKLRRGGGSGPSGFKKQFPVEIASVPVLGPVEHEEQLLDEQYVRSSLNTHRASRHFRNYWHHAPQHFDRFQDLLQKTWPGMDIERPHVELALGGSTLSMMCFENRVPREMYWSGFGFQVWSQLLAHLVRGDKAQLMVLDEPEIYLHPDLQRQLLSILRDLGPDILLATHSTEIMAEAEPSEMLVIDKSKRSAKRLKDHPGAQTAFESIGSFHNVTLTQLARNRRLLFVEGPDDYSFLRSIAKTLGYEDLGSGLGLTSVHAGGFTSWERVQAFGWGVATALDEAIAIGAVFDRDYRSDEEVEKIAADLRQSVQFAGLLGRKEIENYLLIPDLLDRALAAAQKERESRTGVARTLGKSAREILNDVTERQRDDCLAQYIAKRTEYLRSTRKDPATIASETLRWFNERWLTLERRIEIVPGKETLRAFRATISDTYGVTLTNAKLFSSMRRSDIPRDIAELIAGLDRFRSAQPADGSASPS